MNAKAKLVFSLLLLFPFIIKGQDTFTRADSLRGTLNEFRKVYDVSFYDLDITVNPNQRYISGSNTIYYTATSDFRRIQIDLFANMVIDSIVFEHQILNYKREGDAVFIDFPSFQRKGTKGHIQIYYGGRPIVAERPPWDGGFVWEKDDNGNDWIAVACEGIGASLWWPNKDHLSDEPDSMKITCAVPTGLMCVANGNLIDKRAIDNNYTQYSWFVNYPINNYNVSLNIADYVHISDTYKSEDNEQLALDYYVLPYNEEKARTHFKQVHEMLACFEQSYGKYPFWNDGYALVETPYWGMEHQSAIAYGNDYQNNEFGFDFIIVHESAHEYWGNSITVNDHAEMWIHEAFATYAEALYIECSNDYETAVEYLLTQKAKIENTQSILGPMGVNYDKWEDADMYYKGTWMLHSMRNTLNNDALWLDTIKELYKRFAYSHVTTSDIISFMTTSTGYDLQPIFDLFLKSTAVPRLEYRVLKDKNKRHVLTYRWDTPVEGFNMGMKFSDGNGTGKMIYPSGTWQNVVIENPKALHFYGDLFYFKPVALK